MDHRRQTERMSEVGERAPKKKAAGNPKKRGAKTPPPAGYISLEDFQTLTQIAGRTYTRRQKTGRIGPKRHYFKNDREFCYELAEVQAWNAIENRAPDGRPYDAATWPAVWAQLKAKAEQPAEPPPGATGKPGKRRKKR